MRASSTPLRLPPAIAGQDSVWLPEGTHRSQTAAMRRPLTSNTSIRTCCGRARWKEKDVAPAVGFGEIANPTPASDSKVGTPAFVELAFRSTDTAPVERFGFVFTMSGLPSPSRSPIATEPGGDGVPIDLGNWKVPSPSPSRIEMLGASGLVTARSSIPSPFRSAIASEEYPPLAG